MSRHRRVERPLEQMGIASIVVHVAILELLCHAGGRWRDGVIPDVAEAVESPQRLSEDTEQARRLLELVPEMPTPVWGRDELGTGEMWNSNSFISWLLVRSGLDTSSIHPPARGRAPGWHAGLVVARRQMHEAGV